MKIHKPKVQDNEKKCKKERLRKAFGYEYPGDVRVIGVWDAVYKKGSMPKT
tara:strand:+ start:1805 stop:1957 length:153 start_codon:yes stop_codon:yes gene_type:complete